LSQATLTFWDVFDFSGVEDGAIFISTNTATSPDTLAAGPALVDFAPNTALDWEQETVDLTAYVGHTIQVVFAYQAIFGGSSHGWLVDDVSITGLGAGAGGTIVVNKNLGSGSFNLSGPISQSGIAPSTTLTNVPPGQYVVSFTDIPFYLTPPPQTNTLAGGGTNIFTGNYTFPDVNNNGMSDLYEQYYFHTVSATRTRNTDTDGDGMSDYAEFIAGTDPTNALSNLRFVTTQMQGGVTTLQWSAVPGRLYQVQSSTNLQTWTPVTGWLQALGSPLTYVTTNSGTRAILFRVAVQP
jgi:hypothetical protein